MKRMLLLIVVCAPTHALPARAQSLDFRNNPQVEADLLAVEVTGQLRPTPSLSTQIKTDLAAIRSAYPQLADIRVLPSWMPGETLVGLTPDAFASFQAGTFHGF